MGGLDPLGLAGALLGWVIFTVGLGIGDTDIFDFGGIVGAIIGTLIVIAVANWFVRRRSGSTPVDMSSTGAAVVEPPPMAPPPVAPTSQPPAADTAPSDTPVPSNDPDSLPPP